MKEPLNKAEAQVEFTPNSIYKSAGTVTLTMSAEMAAYMLGQVANSVPSGIDLPDGEKLNLYDGVYKALDRWYDNAKRTATQLTVCHEAGERSVKG